MASCSTTRVHVRPAHTNLYTCRHPKGDLARLAGSTRSNSVTGGRDSGSGGNRVRPEAPKVVDSVSCRQMFLRSYKFSRKESPRERTRMKRFGRSVVALFRRATANGRTGCRFKWQAAVRMKRKRSFLAVVRRAKKASSAAFLAVFRRWRCCRG